MRVECFGCDAVIEARDVGAIQRAFVAHGREAHDWSYPEQAVRNYARNFAEAVERLSGDVERREAIGEVTIRAVTPERLDDWARFFDRIGFAGHPSWASCYCLEPHAPAPPELPERAWRESRSRMLDRLERGVAFGYLAYVDDEPVGWVNASFRSAYGLFRGVDPDGPDAATVVGVSCFVVAPTCRRHGVASALLDRVIEDASARGADWVEAYPLDCPEGSDAGRYRGPREMYEARGFGPVASRDHATVMRLDLRSARP